jgi:hypothetical protein
MAMTAKDAVADLYKQYRYTDIPIMTKRIPNPNSPGEYVDIPYMDKDDLDRKLAALMVINPDAFDQTKVIQDAIRGTNKVNMKDCPFKLHSPESLLWEKIQELEPRKKEYADKGERLNTQAAAAWAEAEQLRRWQDDLKASIKTLTGKDV